MATGSVPGTSIKIHTSHNKSTLHLVVLHRYSVDFGGPENFAHFLNMRLVLNALKLDWQQHQKTRKTVNNATPVRIMYSVHNIPKGLLPAQSNFQTVCS